MARALPIACAGLILAGCAGARVTALRSSDPLPPPANPGWLLCMSTDKPHYRPGDIVHVRVLALAALDLAPVAPRLPITVRVTDPGGRQARSLLAWTEDSIASFAWTPAADSGEGTYLISADTGAAPAAPAERRIEVGAEALPTVDLELRMARETWAPGETATMALHVRRPDGGTVEHVGITAVAEFDGHEVWRASPALDRDGAATLAIPVPGWSRSDGSLCLTVDDQGALTTFDRPLRLDEVSGIELIPESGVLIAGVENRCYVHAWRAGGDPVAFAGTVIDDRGVAMATVSSGHEGRARFAFVPDAGRRYVLRLDRPAVTGGGYPLPAPFAGGVALRALDERIAPGAPARLELRSTAVLGCRVELRRRGELIARAENKCSGGVERVTLPVPDGIDGVLVATAIPDDGAPPAERLLFREPARRLSLTVVPDCATHGRGEDASVTVTVRDERGAPASALVSLAVVDAGAEAALPKRDRPPRLPAMALLENEVAALADPQSYLERGAAGDAALDLLLGCQGWRRSIGRDPGAFARTPFAFAAQRILMVPHLWPTWPAMLLPDATQPHPALSSRQVGTPPKEEFAPPSAVTQDSAADEALRFLKRNQRADGGWGQPIAGDAACSATSLAVLAFLGAGYDQRMPSLYKLAMIAAVAWLVAQSPDGSFSTDSSVQGVATCALCEAFAMSNDPQLKQPCERAVAALLAQQVRHEHLLLGWPATATDAPVCDVDASLWAVIGLKSAAAAGLGVGDGLEGGKRYLLAAWRAANGYAEVDAWRDDSTFPTRWDPRDGRCWQPHQPAAGLLMAVFLGHHAGDPLAETLANHVFHRLFPPRFPLPLIDSHQATLGLFQIGGERWLSWNGVFRETMVGAQHHAQDALLGSWDPESFDAFAAGAGRVTTTALAALSLEIYYRYLPVASTPGRAMGSLAAAGPWAHRAVAGDARSDFAGTLLWHGALRTDPRTGTAVARFQTSDRFADFRLVADAVDGRGALGVGEGAMRCGADLELEVRLPERLCVGDEILLPVAVRDRRQRPAKRATLRMDDRPASVVMLADGVGRALLPLHAERAGDLPLALSLDADGAKDSVQGHVAVGDVGFPWRATASGRLGDDGRCTASAIVPTMLVGDAARAQLVLYPSAQARLAGALEALLREPHGCFEQVSATSYPLAMAERLLRARRDVPAATRARISDLLARSYRQLAAYACPGGGFSWWGKDPGQPALTAFGLMQFHDLAEVLPVDREMVAKARDWLLAQRDETGRFHLAAVQDEQIRACVNPYICWTLLESTDDPLSAAAGLRNVLDDLATAATTTGNAHVIALAANALLLAGRGSDAQAALVRLRQHESGEVLGTKATLFGSADDEAEVQTTALALIAWVRAGDAARAASAAGFLLSRCADGAFGTTQATVLALRALAAFEAAQPPPHAGAARVAILVDQREAASVAIPADGDDVIHVDLGNLVTGPHDIELRRNGDRPLPWSLTVSGICAHPSRISERLELTTTLERPTVEYGHPVSLTLAWRAGEEITSPIAVIGLPAGLRPQRAALDALVARKRIASWDIEGDRLALYWNRLADGIGQMEVPCVADLPGRSTGAASRFYAYYHPGDVAWAAPLKVEVSAPAGWSP